MSRTRFEVVSALPDGLFAAALGADRPWSSQPVPALDLDAVVRLAESADLRGRGGAGFPVARKLAAVAAESRRLRLRRSPVLVVNAAEGEPASGKDAALLRHAPGAVLAGARLLAHALRTTDVRIWAPGHDAVAVRAMTEAAQRAAHRGRHLHVSVVAAPDRFVAGEGSAAARGASGREPLPRTDRVRTSVAGVDGRPTLVLNAETVVQLARLALGLPATRLVTVAGAVTTPGVVELPGPVPVGAALGAAGGAVEPLRALLLGGYHGQWYGAQALDLVLGAPDGPLSDCSIVAALPDHACLVSELEAVTDFLARESAGQCGPCAFGLPELARSVRELAAGRVTHPAALAPALVGRGACHHPDGSVGFVTSGLTVLAPELHEHAAGACRRPWRQVLPLPVADAGWPPTVLAELGR